jgi:CubicO group peptidase (beta-lactamase class C family)
MVGSKCLSRMSRQCRRNHFTAFYLVAALVAAPASLNGQPSGDLPSRVDSLFSTWTGTDRPGCAIGVSQRGRVILERGYGMANIELRTPMTPATSVHAASVAKQFTSLVILRLAGEKRLNLDEDVRRFLPELPDYQARYGRPITIRNLLNHTSGLRDFFEMLIIARGQFEEQRITAADAMAVVRRQEALNFSPGAEYGYSNTGYLLAAQIVERVTGQRFGDFIASRIFVPLAMKQTRIRDNLDASDAQSAVGYARQGTGWRTSVPNFDVVGSTNLETTVGDLLRWGEVFDRDSRDSALVRQMLHPGVLMNGDTTTYGFGVSLIRDRGLQVAEHAGRDPGFRAYVGRYLEPNLTVALLCNAAALDPVRLGHEVARLALGIERETPTPAAAPTTVASDAKGALIWAGVYFEPSTRQVAELTVRDGVLFTDRRAGSRVEAIGPRRARLIGFPMELEFDSAAKPGYTVRWLIPGRRADKFEWRAPVAPVLGRSELVEYAGSYYSRELDATYRVEPGDSTLSLHAKAGSGLVARPVFPDGFVSGEYTVQFLRQGRRITGFEISHPRARGLTFFPVSKR